MFPRFARVVTAALLVTALVAILGSTAPARGAFPGENGKLAFVRGGDIWTADPDGSDATQLTTAAGVDRSPRWSAKGDEIAFASNRDGDFEIFVMSSDGSWQRQLTFNDGAQDRFPAWTADGGQIVYDRNFSEIRVVGADGGGERKLADGQVPGTAPHGDRIVFSDASFSLFTMRLDGTGLEQVTDAATIGGFNASWSPRGNDLLFAGEFPEAPPDNDVFLVHADGSGLRHLVDTPDQVEFSPVWSPDGDGIVYESCAPTLTDCAIHILDPDEGSDTQVMTGVDGGTGSVDWQPLRRHRTPGALDLSFGSGGKVLTDISGASFDRADALSLRPHGKVIAVGSSNAAGSFDFALARYDANGSLDPSFGQGGIVLTDFFAASFDLARSIAIQRDGKIVVAGFSRPTGFGPSLLALARYHANGRLDESFGSDGKVVADLGGSNLLGGALAIQRDGKIVAGGDSMAGGSNDFALFRFERDGSPDTSFGSDGMVVTDLGNSSFDVIAGLTIQPEGRIVVVGWSTAGGSDDFALVGYEHHGGLDSTFGVGGKVLTDIGVSSDDIVFASSVDRRGRFVAAGWSDARGNFDFALVRYTRNGHVDTRFGSDGVVLTDLANSSFDAAHAIAIEHRGKLVVAGESDAHAGDFVVVRYEADGALDTRFGSLGRVRTDFGGPTERATSVASDGRTIVVAGLTDGGVSFDFALARYTSRGRVPG